MVGAVRHMSHMWQLEEAEGKLGVGVIWARGVVGGVF